MVVDGDVGIVACHGECLVEAVARGGVYVLDFCGDIGLWGEVVGVLEQCLQCGIGGVCGVEPVIGELVGAGLAVRGGVLAEVPGKDVPASEVALGVQACQLVPRGYGLAGDNSGGTGAGTGVVVPLGDGVVRTVVFAEGESVDLPFAVTVADGNGGHYVGAIGGFECGAAPGTAVFGTKDEIDGAALTVVLVAGCGGLADFNLVYVAEPELCECCVLGFEGAHSVDENVVGGEHVCTGTADHFGKHHQYCAQRGVHGHVERVGV